ncbi:hypothetical protein [Nostoc sp. PA-18-2419]|uniref:hypothetical protein n=1 Tax=Nostoc sp. PA-18-2419 TaxID=2575443 RepID=UPI0016758A16|nr:hypothetical protein [Nostoc sp. PA-18-2419]
MTKRKVTSDHKASSKGEQMPLTWLLKKPVQCSGSTPVPLSVGKQPTDCLNFVTEDQG